MSDDLQKQIEEAQRKALEMQQQMIQQAQNQAFEMQRSMMAAQGMSPEQIEQYLGQSMQDVNAMHQHMMSQNADAIMNMLGGDDEEEKNEFLRQHPQPQQYARYLALGAIFMSMRGEPVETLELMDDDIDDCKEDIEDSWGITDHDSSVEMIESLLQGRSYQKVNPVYLTLVSGKRDGVADDDIVSFLATVESLEEINITKGEIIQCPSTYAWDIERAAFLARVCTHMGYITPDEAWNYLERAGKITKEQFTNWRDYGVSIVMGRALTMGYHESYFYALEEMLIDEPEYLQSIPISSF